MRPQRKTWLFKADPTGEDKRELEFELRFQRSLSVQERFTLMRSRSRLLLSQLIDHGHRRPFEILKRI